MERHVNMPAENTRITEIPTKRFAHVLQLRLTRPDLTFLHRMAEVRRCTIEELIRAELCLRSPDIPAESAATHHHLRLIRADESMAADETGGRRREQSRWARDAP
jgi:hypothetical protein